MFTKTNFIEAYFPNDNRDVIKVVYKSGDKRLPHFISVDPDHDDFKKLMKIVTMDQIEEKTNEVIDAQWKAVEEIQRKILEEKTQAAAPAKESLEPIDMLNFLLFFDKEVDENKSNEEKLFSLKIACFDLEIIEEAPDDVKESIRTAANPLELINRLYDYVHNS